MAEPEQQPQRTRELKLLTQGSPCGTNFFDRNLLTVAQAVDRGIEYCPNFGTCDSSPDGVYCALRNGLDVAKYVIQKGYGLKKEMGDFARADFLANEFWNSVDGKNFKLEIGKAKFVRAVEGFARIVLLMDAFGSVFPNCEKCDGIRLEEVVYDSIHEFPRACAGSGRTRRRVVEYCPDCEQKPIGTIINEEPEDDLSKKLMGHKD